MIFSSLTFRSATSSLALLPFDQKHHLQHFDLSIHNIIFSALTFRSAKSSSSYSDLSNSNIIIILWSFEQQHHHHHTLIFWSVHHHQQQPAIHNMKTKVFGSLLDLSLGMIQSYHILDNWIHWIYCGIISPYHFRTRSKDDAILPRDNQSLSL